jgi:hypothetical protein
MIFDKQTIDAVNRRFHFVCDGTEQDWPIEVSDKDRLPEFIATLETGGLSEKEEIAIAALAVASYEDYLYCNEDDGNSMWKELSEFISAKKDLYSELIDYWSLHDKDDAENMFRVTPLMRRLVDKG